MSGLGRPWPVVFLLLLALAGCGVQAPASHPGTVSPATGLPASSSSSSEESSPKEAEPGPLPPVVVENQAFVTIEGIPQYKIGPGDVLDVLLTRELAQDRLSVEVRANGNIIVGFFEATVAGLTTGQAAMEIQRVLAPAHKQLVVEVMVKEYRSKTVSVLGAVLRDGRFPLKGRTNLLDLLAEAGGPTADADLRAVRLLRPDDQPYTIDLLRLVSKGQRFRELLLDAGDVVFVPTRKPEKEKKVFLLGEVQKPGAYPFIPKMRLSQALAQAGGPKDTAVLESARVIRGDLREPQVLQVDFKGIVTGRDYTQDLSLKTNDVIVVPRSAIGNWNAFLAKLKPTLQFLALPLQPIVQMLLIQDLLED